jgi:hypothetical protein
MVQSADRSPGASADRVALFFLFLFFGGETVTVMTVKIKHDSPIGVKTVANNLPIGRFLTRRGLRKKCPEALDYFSRRNVLGAIWQKSEKKLHLLVYDHFFDEITMYTFELE